MSVSLSAIFDSEELAGLPSPLAAGPMTEMGARDQEQDEINALIWQLAEPVINKLKQE